MIIGSAPLRISLAGGGSDLPGFTEQEQGAVVSATLGLRVYVCLQQRRVDPGVRLAYSKTEIVRRVEDLEHDLARCALLRHGIHEAVEIATVSDAPAGTGLGSSAAFTVALLKAIDALWYKPRYRGVEDIAQDACIVEGIDCGRVTGRQDQYAAAIGGLNYMEFLVGGLSAPVTGMNLEHHSTGQKALTERLGAHLLLLYTGRTRQASEVLRKLDFRDSRIRANVRSQANLAVALKDHLVTGDIDAVGEILRAGWALKHSLPGVSTPEITEWYQRIMAAGGPRCGAKLLGAGGGGCFLVYAPPERHPTIVQALPELQRIPVDLVSSHGVRTAQT